MKILKSKKALSPVIASIILIAVTVAVSIAVAAWMGALTFTFMKTEELKITSMTFDETVPGGGNGTTITLAVHNTGTGSVTVANAKVNGATVTCPPTTVEAGAPGSIIVTMPTGTTWTTGDKYRVELISSTGTPVAAYEDIAS